jgi:hypothetical protein
LTAWHGAGFSREEAQKNAKKVAVGAGNLLEFDAGWSSLDDPFAIFELFCGQSNSYPQRGTKRHKKVEKLGA